MLRLIALLFVLSVIASAQLIDSNEMPWGCYSSQPSTNQSYFSNQRLEWMNDTLGFNQHTCGGFDEDEAERFANRGVYIYPWGTGVGAIEPQTKWAGATYFISHPEDTSWNVKFRTRDGYDYYESPDSFWACSTSTTMLNDLSMPLPNRYDWLDPDYQLEYYPALRMKVDSLSSGIDDSLVGVFWVEKTWPNRDTLLVDSIYLEEVQLNNLTLHYLSDDWSTPPQDHFTVWPVYDSTRGGYIWCKFESMGNFKIYIDYFKLHDQHGDDVVDSSLYDNDIKQSAGRDGFDGHVLGWFLKDTQRISTFRTFAYIDDLIRDTTEAEWDDPVAGATWLIPSSGTGMSAFWGDGYRDFARLTQPEMLWTYLYPIGPHTKYTGNESDELQYNLNYNITTPLDSIRSLINDYDYLESWLYTPQFWYCDDDDCYEHRREPTKSELRCQIFIGMCYQPGSIILWKYDGTYDSNPTTYSTRGLVYYDSQGDSLGLYRMGQTVKDYITPYIKAIDSVYLRLEWDDADYVSPTHDPDISLIESVKATPYYGSERDVNPPPDNGWFHVAEFTDTVSKPEEKYFMLINRSCSKDENGNEAPPVTTIVKFNPTLGVNYALITDVAHTVNDTGTGWYGIPETTYTALMPDTNLYFTTILQAGEGRLFRIVSTSEIVFPDDIDYDYVYQGRISIDSSFTVDTLSTLQIKGPARFEFSGLDSILVEGGLIAKGSEGDTVIFVAVDTIVAWQGIRFKPQCDTAWFSYCKFEDAYDYSILVDSTEVELKNSYITDSQIGIKVVNSGEFTAQECKFEEGENGLEGIWSDGADSLDISYCKFNNYTWYGIYNKNSYLSCLADTFDCIDYYGIYADSAESEIGYCNFYDIGLYGIYAAYSETEINSCSLDVCKKYGIYIDNHPSGNYDLSKITNCVIEMSSPPNPDNTQYGIRADDIDKIHIFDNSISGYNQGGIKLYNSDAKVHDNVIHSCGKYGIYSSISDKTITRCKFDSLKYGIFLISNSAPTVRGCEFNSVGTGVTIFGNQQPVFGDSANGDTTKWGKSNFEGCSNYYFQQITVWPPVPLIKAEMNYFGRGIPDESKFMGNIDYTPWLNEWRAGKVVDDIVPLVYQLNSNYPNPFNPNTHISFNLADPGYTTISIYNILGQKIGTLVNEYKPAGHYSVMWNGTNRSGKPVSSGIYFYRLESNEFTDTKKMLLLR